jgi:acetylornithine deacetylase/succinyl-diaminopimelate desuccinylase-like protein
MKIVHSRKVHPAESLAKVAALLKTINEKQLRDWVEHISVPRHFGAEPEQNRAIAAWLQGLFESMGFRVERQGKYSNIVAFPEDAGEEVIVVGAHYDSVPMCPGADEQWECCRCHAGLCGRV